jgi:DNA-binding transcriptional ArsR family regulator
MTPEPSPSLTGGFTNRLASRSWRCFGRVTAPTYYSLNVTDLSKGNLSAHLRKLEQAGYLTITKSFKGRYPNTACALTKEGRRAFSAYRKQYLAFAQHLQE